MAVSLPGGTGYNAKKKYGPKFQSIGGKTGTTQDYRDAWFVGFTPKITCVVWIGYDSNSKSQKISGGVTAAPIAMEYLKEIYKYLPTESFE